MCSFVAKALLVIAALAVGGAGAQSLPAAPEPSAIGQPAVSPIAESPELLTRREAEQIALRNNPRISIATLLGLAQRQVIRETRSAELPTLNGSFTGVGAEEASRISSGSLAASRLLNHVGGGIELNQLITDFGRTRNLVASSTLQAKATEQNAQATRADIVLAADLAFYSALEAQATLQVAQSTVATRQTSEEQVNALTVSNLKSTLDQSFAQVTLSQGKLLVLDAQNQSDASMARLQEILGAAAPHAYRLVDDTGPLQEAPISAEAVLALALQQRPDLQAMKLAHDADVRFSRAQKEQRLPKVSAMGIVGGTAYGSGTYFLQPWYGAGGVNVNVPIFNGFKFSAQGAEADLRAKASDERSRELTDRIVRDVRTAWLMANTARQRIAVTGELVKQADSALDLAQTRYRLGLSSIVELSQAQLQQTQAQIAEANARFEYEADLATLRFQSGEQP